MENASKAIIIAGSILVGILLLAIAVSLWRNYSSFSTQNQDKTRMEQYHQFNAKFEKYNYDLNGNKYVTAQDVRTIANLVNDYNSNYDEKVIDINFTYKGIPILNLSKEKWVEFLEESNSLNKDAKYQYKIQTEYEQQDIIKRIKITKK